LAHDLAMATTTSRTVRLDVSSRLEMLDVVQTVLVHSAAIVGFDEDATHYLSVAVRESVVNAMKHGNRLERERNVEVRLVLAERALEVTVRDEGTGFDPTGIPDPLAAENLLKPAGRGIFFMRSFMDEVSYSFPASGGTLVRMVKRLP
jgi:serine/threonine-protein kinase RsbW